jgi:hypothetical protein
MSAAMNWQTALHVAIIRFLMKDLLKRKLID